MTNVAYSKFEEAWLSLVRKIGEQAYLLRKSEFFLQLLHLLLYAGVLMLKKLILIQ